MAIAKDTGGLNALQNSTAKRHVPMNLLMNSMLNEMLPRNYNAITNRTDSPFAGCRSFTFQHVAWIEMAEICFKACVLILCLPKKFLRRT